MKRICLLSILLGLSFSFVRAAYLSPGEAMQAAGEFLAARGMTSSEIHPAGLRSRSLAPAAHMQPESSCHLFNIGDGEGFIIVGGGRDCPSVIGYSLQGSISPDNIPAPLADLLDLHDGGSLSYSTPAPNALSYPEFSVEPLIQSKWDQRDPFDLRCPLDVKTGLRCAVGCVATAAAQVMGYYKYPAKAEGYLQYEDRIQGVTRSFDFSQMPPIDWDSISDTYSSASSEKQRDAVSVLMNAVAHGSRMQFSSDTSMAYGYNAGAALIDFFGYSPDMHSYERALLSDQEWISIITSELLAGRPVIYEGKNPSMGHAFVCDGYDGRGYFHINWGWSGLSDGYFSLSALTPPSQSTGGSDSGYSLYQSILTNIAPKGTEGLVTQEAGLLNIDKLYFRDSSQFHIAAGTEAVVSALADAMLFFYSFNKGMRPFGGDICVATADVDAANISPLSVISIEDLASRDYTAVRFPVADLGLSDGRHSVAFYYRTSPAAQWHPISSSTPGAPSGCILSISGSQVAMSPVYPDIMPGKVTSLSHSRLYANTTASVCFDLSNSGSVRLEAYAGIAIMDAGGRYLSLHSVPLLCPAADKAAVELKVPLRGLEPGEYGIMPFYSYNSNPEATDIRPLAGNPFPVVVEGVVIRPTGTSWLKVEPADSRFGIDVTNLNAVGWTAPVKVDFIAPATAETLECLEARDIEVGPSATASFDFDCSGISLSKGNYTARFIIDEEPPVILTEIPMMVTADMASVSAVAGDALHISLSPSGFITISVPERISSVTVCDTAGSIVTQLSPSSSEAYISLDSLAPGIYIIRVATQSGLTSTKKLKI